MGFKLVSGYKGWPLIIRLRPNWSRNLVGIKPSPGVVPDDLNQINEKVGSEL